MVGRASNDVRVGRVEEGVTATRIVEEVENEVEATSVEEESDAGRAIISASGGGGDRDGGDVSRKERCRCRRRVYG